MGIRGACTLYDVARAAGVSTATVSRVVHGNDRVRPSTRQRVLKVIDDLGYVPDAAAQSMAWQRKEVIGLVTMAVRGQETDVEREGVAFIEEVLRGVQVALSPVGWSVLISVLTATDQSDAYQQLRKISAKVDGMVIAEGIVGSEQLAQLAQRIPVVLAAGSIDEPHVDVVDADNMSGTTALVRHMLEQHGKKRLFYIDGPAEAPDAGERRRAFEEAVAQQPGAAVVGCFEGRFAAVSGQLAVREMIAAPGRELPDAIICGNDQMAIGAMRELQAAGIRVPADVAVTGFDDIRFGALYTPSLTTVRQSLRLLGERACSCLLERIADPALPRRAERLPTELIVRESCGCPPAEGPRYWPPADSRAGEDGGRRDEFRGRQASEPVPGSARQEAITMAGETVSSTIIIDAPAGAIFAVLADPASHPAIDGTGWVCESLDTERLAAEGQVFRMTMYHPGHPDGNYQMANRVQVFDPPRAISWKPGYDAGDGTLQFGGWVWRYDLAPAGPSRTEVTLSYDWSAVGDGPRQRIKFPPFAPDHLGNSLAHLADLVTT